MRLSVCMEGALKAKMLEASLAVRSELRGANALGQGA